MQLVPGEWQGFPYAVRLAEERGAMIILIQPRLKDPLIQGEIRPDVFGARPSSRPLIIEVEDSSGKKFQKDGPRDRESALKGEAEFVFIIGPGAKGRCERKLKQMFGDNVELIELSALEEKYGDLVVASRAVQLSGEPDSTA